MNQGGGIDININQREIKGSAGDRPKYLSIFHCHSPRILRLYQRLAFYKITTLRASIFSLQCRMAK
jgi:hypothetical protein